MQVEEITQILRESPSVRLIKSRSVDFFLSFVIEAFEGQAAIMQERLHMLLENRLDEQENTLVEDDSEMTRLVESNEQKAKRLIKDWTDKGFLTNYQNEEGEVIYEISSHTSKLIDWVVSLKKEDYIGTESKFKTLFSQLKELVEYSNEDREKRLELLRTKKMEIEHQIQRLEMGEEVEVYEDYQIEPRYNSLNKLAKELLSDFKEVDDNFKGIIKEIYEHQIREVGEQLFLPVNRHNSTPRSLVLTFSRWRCWALDCCFACSSSLRMEGFFSFSKFFAENSRKAAVITSASRPLKNTR